MSDVELPTSLRYTRDHEWVSLTGQVARVGITAYAQDALGDIVYVNLPRPGQVVSAGQACAEVESTKSVSDIYAPIDGTVAAGNELLETSPELVNSDPYGDGWMFEITVSDQASLAGLLGAAEYRLLLG